MITADQQSRWFQQQISGAGLDLPGQKLAWLSQVRGQGRRAGIELPPLDRKHESWRYTSVDALLKNHYEPVADDPASVRDLEIGKYLLPSFAAYRLVFVNGHWVPHLSDTKDLPVGVTLGSLRAAFGTDADLLATWFGQVGNHTEHVFTALNTALINDGLFLHVDRGVELEQPIEVIYLNLSGNTASLVQPRNLIVLAAGAKATVIERCLSAGQSVYFHNNLTELLVGESAVLDHHRLQDESRNAYHLSSLYLSQARNSRYCGSTTALGGVWARTDYNVTFKQEGAACLLSGLYTVGDQQLMDFHLNVQHGVPGCTSREQFKGILYGKGRAVFDGRILVEKQAQRSDASLTNDNLMLTRDAEVDTKPQLEIYANDVKCSHGTTVGQLDPQQMFYLRSRGIDAVAARKMLSLGFAGEIIDTIPVPALREHISNQLASTLDAVPISGL